jgi:hypothetical protein
MCMMATIGRGLRLSVGSYLVPCCFLIDRQGTLPHLSLNCGRQSRAASARSSSGAYQSTGRCSAARWRWRRRWTAWRQWPAPPATTTTAGRCSLRRMCSSYAMVGECVFGGRGRPRAWSVHVSARVACTWACVHFRLTHVRCTSVFAGRHVLTEQLVERFIPNDTLMGGGHARLHVSGQTDWKYAGGPGVASHMHHDVLSSCTVRSDNVAGAAVVRLLP